MSDRTGIDLGLFRRVLGHYPTGVCVVTAVDSDAGPVGMTIGSFTSVSLDPPLVAFYPMRDSATFTSIATAGAFCVNILSGDQEWLCRRFASREADKFQDVAWRPSALGAPILDDVLAWVDCRVESVHPAGDHLAVFGEVVSLSAGRTTGPLMFFQGGYGRFTAMSLLAEADDALGEQLRLAELARPALEDLAQSHAVEAYVTAVLGDQVTQLAWVGADGANLGVGQVGLRLPLVPPIGLVFVAWEDEQRMTRWLARTGGLSERARASYLGAAARAREQGWVATPDSDRLRRAEDAIARIASEGLSADADRVLREHVAEFSEEYAAAANRTAPADATWAISAPVFDHAGRVNVAIGIRSISPHTRFNVDTGRDQVLRLAAELATATRPGPTENT